MVVCHTPVAVTFTFNSNPNTSYVFIEKQVLGLKSVRENFDPDMGWNFRPGSWSGLRIWTLFPKERLYLTSCVIPRGKALLAYVCHSRQTWWLWRLQKVTLILTLPKREPVKLLLDVCSWDWSFQFSHPCLWTAILPATCWVSVTSRYPISLV